MKIIILFFCLIVNSISVNAAQSLEVSSWDLQAINASRIVYNKQAVRAGEKKLNLYLSPIMTKQALSFVDHTTFKPYSELMVGELAGTPAYSADGQYIFISAKDGWIWKYNLHTGSLEIKVRVGLNTAASVLSGDGRFLLAANRQPADLVFLNPDDLSVVQIIPVRNLKGVLSPVSLVRNAGDEHGFIVIPENFPQLWKVSYLDPPPIGFGDGWNHDYRCLKDHMDKPLFPIKRLNIEQSLTDLYVDEENIYVTGVNSQGESLVFDLDLSRIVGRPGTSFIAPDLLWTVDDASELAVLNNDKRSLSIYSNASHSGQWLKTVDIDIAHAAAIASCPRSEQIMIGDKQGKVLLVNKYSHKIEQILQPVHEPVNSISCTPDGQYMFLEVGNKQKKLLVYDNQQQKFIQ